MAIDPAQRFFFYGTLITGGPRSAHRARQRLRDLGAARVPGTLHAIPDPAGWYPAMLEGAGQVFGRLFEATAKFTEADLAVLDDYEDFRPREPASSLYRRIAVCVAGKPAQVYVFNQPLPPGTRPIPDGDFAAWIAREGLATFSG